MANSVNARWQVVRAYRTDAGPVDFEDFIEELAELHDLIERGPDWNCLEYICINLMRRTSTKTIEQSLAE